MNRILPPVTKYLLIINGLFFLIRMQNAEYFDNLLGLHFFTSPLFKPWQLVTHIFMHGSIGHIFSNMLALWMFGSVIENRWGTKRFLTYYFVTGLGAAMLHFAVTGTQISRIKSEYEIFAEDGSYEGYQRFMHNAPGAREFYDEHTNQGFTSFMEAWAKEPGNPALSSEALHDSKLIYENFRDQGTIGASGAVFGILLAFGLLFPNEYVYFYFMLPIKAKYFVFLYGALEFFLGMSHISGDNVAHFAHLGGMLFGWLLIWYWRRNEWNKRRWN